MKEGKKIQLSNAIWALKVYQCMSCARFSGTRINRIASTSEFLAYDYRINYAHLKHCSQALVLNLTINNEKCRFVSVETINLPSSNRWCLNECAKHTRFIAAIKCKLLVIFSIASKNGQFFLLENAKNFSNTWMTKHTLKMLKWWFIAASVSDWSLSIKAISQFVAEKKVALFCSRFMAQFIRWEIDSQNYDPLEKWLQKRYSFKCDVLFDGWKRLVYFCHLDSAVTA